LYTVSILVRPSHKVGIMLFCGWEFLMLDHPRHAI